MTHRGSRGKSSGWQATSRTPDAAQPTRWERLLTEMKLSEQDAVRHPRVRDWVRVNCHRAYVPEKVLDAVCMEVNYDWGDA